MYSNEPNKTENKEKNQKADTHSSEHTVRVQVCGIRAESGRRRVLREDEDLWNRELKPGMKARGIVDESTEKDDVTYAARKQPDKDQDDGR